MAIKRAAESDAEERSTPPKRARISSTDGRKSKFNEKETAEDDSSGEESSGSSQNMNNDGEDSDNDLVEDEVAGKSTQRRKSNVETEAEFERKNADRVKESLGRKRTGNAAEAGIISSVELHNFMCHKYFTVNLGPQVNFIIGNNGSGKSAALSGIIVALGGKAASTGRAAAGIKSFIKSGESAAEVTVTIKNGGQEPYSPEKYGAAIKVTRHFTQTGATTYKIKAANGKTVSTQRAELAAILDHYQIDVDNPMNILTQDLARQFLSASDPSDKYNLFLKGTLLMQLYDEYEQIRDSCSKTMAILKQKKVSVEEIGAHLADVRERHQRAQSLIDARKAIEGLEARLAWAHVAAKEEELSKGIEETQQEQERANKIQEKIQEAEAQVAETAEQVTAAEIRFQQARTPEALKDEQKEINATVKDIKEEIRKAKRDAKELADEIKDKKKALKASEEKIKQGHEKLARDAERDNIRQKIEAAEAAHKEARSRHEKSVVEKNNAKDSVEGHTRDFHTLERKFEEVSEELRGAEAKVNQLQDIAKGQSGAAIYGRWVPAALREIESARWTGRKPVGPLGLHVRLKDNRWADVLRVGIGGFLGGFAVTNHKDQQTLRRILDNHGAHRTGIVVGQPDLFDFRSGEAPSSLLTVLRVLEFSDEWVLRLLINNSHIERLLLADNREHAEAILRDHPQFIVWTADAVRVQRFGDNGGQTSQIGRITNPQDYRNLLFTENREKEVLEYAGMLAERSRVCNLSTNSYINRSKLRKELCKSQRMTLRGRRQVLVSTEDHCLTSLPTKAFESSSLTAAKRTNAAWQAAKVEDVQEKPLDLSSEEEIAEGLRFSLNQDEAGLQDVMRRQNELEARSRPLVQREAEIRAEIGRHDDGTRVLQSAIQEAVASHVAANNDEKYYRGKLEDQMKKVGQATTKQEILEQEYTTWRTQVATRFGAELQVAETVKQLEKSLKAKKAAFERSQQEQGQTPEQIEDELARATANYERAKADFTQLHNLIATFSVTDDATLYGNSNGSMAGIPEVHVVEVQTLVPYPTPDVYSFQYYLAERGFFGQIQLDHDKKTLALTVQTDDQKMIDGKGKQKDAKMSGGEKSFSTICLLLSLWDAMNCPIRALDEFDVYMDAVNRRISMKMMLDVAKNSDKQHILITPQEMGNIQLGPEIRVHRMRDPERGQQTLSF
ncbi:Structural maintenance of chromosomes protein 6 [Serendipita sp. 399]|nr:Structural maintenance of chromosomes protein 6 [Serendipita sp. 399]